MNETVKPSTRDKILGVLAILLSVLFMLASACAGMVFTFLSDAFSSAAPFLLLAVLFLAFAILLLREGNKRLRQPRPRVEGE